MAICNSCGKQNEQERIYCKNCGNKIIGPKKPLGIIDVGENIRSGSITNEEMEKALGIKHKSRTIAFFLSLFFGFLGLGRLYLGYSKEKAVQHILFSFLFSPWQGFSDSIKILTGKMSEDADGVSLE